MSPHARRPLQRSAGTAIATALLLAACGGGDGGAGGAAGETGAAQAPAAGGTGTGAGSTQSTPQLIALGDSIYHGQAAGGICYTCHGPDAKGTALAPNLTDDEWINIDGSREQIANVVRTGVPQPKQHPGPMPPFGPSLSDQQLQAVAAYVHSLSNPGA